VLVNKLLWFFPCAENLTTMDCLHGYWLKNYIRQHVLHMQRSLKVKHYYKTLTLIIGPSNPYPAWQRFLCILSLMRRKKETSASSCLPSVICPKVRKGKYIDHFWRMMASAHTCLTDKHLWPGRCFFFRNLCQAGYQISFSTKVLESSYFQYRITSTRAFPGIGTGARGEG